MKTLDLLCRAVSQAYASDPSKPSVTVSCIASGYYASVVRYTEGYGGGKSVVCNAKADTLDECVEKLARRWDSDAGAVAALRGHLRVDEVARTFKASITASKRKR